MTASTADPKSSVRRRLRLQIIAAQFRLRYSLEQAARLEANTLSFVREVEVLQTDQDSNSREVLGHAVRQLDACRDQLNFEQRYCLDAVVALHAIAIEAATQLPDDATVADLVEKLVRLPLPTCPRPGAEVDSQRAITAWLDDTVVAVPKRVQSEYLAHVDALVEAVSAPSSSAVM